MAEAVAGIAGKIVASLAPQALEYAGKLWGVKDEVKALMDTVSTLKAVLNNAEEQYHGSPQIQVWVNNLKEAFYDAQDVLEEFNIEAVRRELRGQNEAMKEVRTFFSSSNQLAFKMKMSYKLRAVRERIEAIKADKGFHLEERPERERRKREETHSFIREGDIIGRDKDKKAIMKFLLDSDVQENVSILPIVGIGGLGKTALAQWVYNDEIVNKQFDLKMWVCVSDNFDMTKIIKDMIACVKKNEPTKVAKEQLQKEVRKEIDGKRYLLVLDDVWTTKRENWLELKPLLMGGARGSKILITTRLPLVAEITGTAPPHHLGGLSESASIDLLMQMACLKDPEMLAMGKDIVSKCAGVPLVICAVGNILFFKKTKSEWLHFKDNELPEVSQHEGRIISTLRLSYNYLPSHLKQCFAICSLFPKDYKMDKQTLVDLWMAEGFIQPSNTSLHLEDIAHGYFMDLLWSNFFQDHEKDPIKNKETCKMHDLMHDLAILVAGNECWMARDGTKPTLERTRHVSYCSISNLMGALQNSRLKASVLRAFLLPIGDETMNKADLCKLIQSFKRLRILDLNGSDVKKVPRSICKLKHLTYLNLSGNYALKRLPNSMTRLQSLQTLNLNGCNRLEELPRGIRKLVSLRNLDIDGCSKLCFMPRGLGQLSSLHRLRRFILLKDKALAKDYCELGELNGLNNIRGSLRIEELGHERDPRAESGTANLEGKKFLDSLELVWSSCVFEDAERAEALLDGLRPHSNLQKLRIEGYGGKRFPTWMIGNRRLNLVELSFHNCGICKQLSVLGQLPDLKKLEISGLSELEYNEPNPSAPSTPLFPSLLTLNISSCRKLKALPPIPSLLKLNIEDCGNLKALPPASRLEELSISRLSELEYDEPNPLAPSTLSFPSLLTLHIFNCEKLKALPPLPSLLKLKIKECGNLKALPPTPLLEELFISRLSELEYIIEPKPLSLPPSTPSSFPSLLTLDISSCGKLKALPPIPSLLKLGISDCGNLKALPPTPLLEELLISKLSELEYIIEPKPLPSSTPSFPSLLTLSVSSCGKLKALPPIPSLLKLGISDCDKLKALPPTPRLEELRIYSLSELEYNEPNPSAPSTPSFPSLLKLEISNCRKLKALPPTPRLEELSISFMSEQLEYIIEPNPSAPSTPSFPSLLKLKIHSCEELKALPPTPHLEELKLYHVNKEVINHILGLCKLRTLYIERMELREGLPEECLKSLTSLVSLDIQWCYGLTSLSRGMRHLSNLVHLYIDNCPQLDICKDESGNILDFHPLPPLITLHIYRLPKLESLPPWLLQLTTLEHLYIEFCKNLKELPEQIEALQSLQLLQIDGCFSLESLPEGMRRLTSLTSLWIFNCPKLEKRCKKYTGKDWRKIAHIPDRMV